tara:strand:- start:133 stop:870 length:738 start_codon:yes stop_codon:yes gene_type:complete
MYEAMGVQQIEQLLPPPPQPQPVSPSMENAGFLQGQPAQAFPDQDHDAHITAHISLLRSPIVQNVPQGQMQAAAMIQSHIYQHIDFKAREMAQQDPQIMQMNQQMQMMQQQAQMNPMMQQQLQAMQQQMMPIMEDKVATITTQLLEQLGPALSPQMPDDPLVKLRDRELDIKEEDMDRKAREAQQRIDIEQERVDNNKELAEDRMEVQAATAEMKDQIARERINVQRSAQMAKTAENIAKDFFGN